MTNLRFGMKEVANVVFFDLATNKPVVFFDTLKVSTIDNESESGDSTGGRGNNKLISWDYNRTASLTISDALLSDTTIAMLAGTEIKKQNIEIVKREQLFISGNTITLEQTPISNSLNAFLYEKGMLSTDLNVSSGDISGKIVSVDAQHNNKEVMVFYEYLSTSGANQIVFSGVKFPSTYRIVGDTYVISENGVAHKMQFEIPKAKMQSTMSIPMDVENVATFDFTLEVLIDMHSDKRELYRLTRISPPEKALPKILGNVSNLSASNITATSTTLTWDSGLYATSYDIERDGVLIDNVTGLEFKDFSLAQEATYNYTVKARNADGVASGASIAVETTAVAGVDTAGVNTWVGGIE